MPNGEICLRVWSQHATRVARVYSTRPCSSLAKVVGDNSGIILHDTANTLRSPYVIGRRRNATSLCSLTPIMEQSRVTNLESFLYTTAPITNLCIFQECTGRHGCERRRSRKPSWQTPQQPRPPPRRQGRTRRTRLPQGLEVIQGYAIHQF